MIAGSIELVELYAPIREDLARVESIIECELFSDHPFVNDLCARVGGYRGKMVRPALLLLSGSAGGEIGDAHRTLAGVVEIVHLATLVHDDVLDGAAMRRRRATINAANGNTAAVLLGDYLISHAYHLCGSLNDRYASRAISATTNTVCEGELIEIHHRRDADISEAVYFDIIRGKTASLIATCCELGARYAGADRETTSRLRSFGEDAGLAFQIVDDVLDLSGEESRTGKDAGLDLARGSATLPVIHCLAHTSGPAADRLRACVGGESSMTGGEIRDLLDASGSVDYALGVARSRVQSALGHLATLPASPAADSLSTMAEFILRRNF